MPKDEKSFQPAALGLWCIAHRPDIFRLLRRGCKAKERQRRSILPPVVQLRRPGRLMIGDMLRHFQLATVLKIRGDAGSTEGMIADLRLDAGGFHDRDAVEKRAGLVSGEEGVLPFLTF